MKSHIPGITLDAEPIVSSRNIVYRAHDSAGRALIVKILGEEYPSASSMARFQTEYEIVSKLSGPGVEKAVGLYPWDHTLAMVLEDSGPDLRGRLHGQGLSLPEFFDLAIALVEALRSVHAARIIHKDINPSNICWNPSSKTVRLIDFGIAADFDAAGQATETAFEGSLPYLAPEQSGRMNRRVDYRSDYYSLGITFYEVLTGKLPFQAEDTLDWIHQHLTREPVPAHDLRPEIPKGVAAIISKLMQKNADERYQSSFGLLHDLKSCHEAWQKGEGPASFVVGSRDIPEQFVFPPQIFGRETELGLLTSAYASLQAGTQRQIFILGDEGVGKSAFIKDHFRFSLDQHAYLIEGRFEEHAKDVPFFALRAALPMLAKSLLLENEVELQRLRKQLAVALEGQAGSLLVIAPQLEWIIGPQNQKENQEGELARNRCIYLLLQFFKIVARKNRPIILFLDNLQWADNPSLQFLRQLTESGDIHFVMTVMAAREQGLKPDEGVMKLIQDSKDLPQTETLRLDPMSESAVCTFLARTFHCSEGRVASLAALLLEKTNGNPFFLQSLLKQLHEDGAVFFDQDLGAWTWDVEAIAKMDISDNVIDVILKKMARLTPEAQQVLKMSACIGVKFRTETLLAIQGNLGEDAIKQALQVGVREGFLVREILETTQELVYRFQRDRMQQALYALLTEAERMELHLKIGRCLARALVASDADAVTAMIRHLNVAAALLNSSEEKLQLAHFNFQAGIRALQATAYESGCTYLQVARQLTGEQGWSQNYELVYQIHLKLCEGLFNAGHSADSLVVHDLLKVQARGPIDRAQVHLLRAYQLNLQGRLEEALDEALSAIQTLGVRLSRQPNPLGIVWLYLKNKKQMTPAFFDNYQTRFQTVDASISLQMKILSCLVLISYQLKLDNLMATAVELATFYSCRYGFTKESAGAFVNHAVILTNVFKDFTVPPRLCALADVLDQHFDCIEERPYLKFVACCFTYNLHGSFDECLAISQAGEKWAAQIGDMAYQLYNQNASITIQNYVYHLDPDLVDLENKIRRTGDNGPYWMYYLWLMPSLSLIGSSGKPTTLDSDYMSEATLYEKNAANPLSVTAYHLFKAMLAVIFEEKELAYEHGVKALPVLKALVGLTEQLMIPYHFLSFSQSYKDLDASRQRRSMRILQRMLRRVTKLAEKLPKNLKMVQWLMEAEIARLRNQRELAATRFDQAIQGAQQASYTSMIALFNDIAGRFYLETGKARIASLYFKEAFFHYDLWGAKEKLRDMKDRYEDLLGERVIKRDGTRTRIPRTAMHTTTGNRNDAGSELDLMAVVKASEILASEVVLESLLIKLMRTTIQSTGAQNGSLILKEDDQFHVCAEIRQGHESGLLEIPLEKSEHVPQSLIQFALRSNEPLVVDDVSERHELLSDPYIAEHRPQSMLCVPIVSRAQICGVIYLEHRSVQGTFTLDRVKVLSVIASQAAIFISNARLYASLEAKVAHRTRELATKTKDIQTMLQNIKQGIFTIQADLTIHNEYSAYLETIWGQTQLADRNALELLLDHAQVSADKRVQMQTVMELCLQGEGTGLAFAVNGHLLPHEIIRKRENGHEQFLELDWQAIENESGGVDKLMVVVRDMTEIRELRHEAEEQRRELHALSQLINAGAQASERFFTNCREKIAANEAILRAGDRIPLDGIKLIFRNLHTIKGNARTLGFDEVAAAVHPEEEIYSRALIEGTLIPQGNELLLGHQRCLDSVALYERVYQKTLKGLQAVSGLQPDAPSSSLDSILMSIRNSLPGLASELQKAPPELKLTPCPASFPKRTADVLGDVMMHCIRNSLDHGIEFPLERKAQGKSEQGLITIDCELSRDASWLVIRVYDDGRGIHLQALEEKARALQLLAPGADDQTIAHLVFVEGISTKSRVTAISGRGIGMDAVKAALEGLGASIEIEFLGPVTADRHRPFCFKMILPASCLAEQDQHITAA